MSKTTVIPGGWTPYRPLTKEDKEVFRIALEGLLGVHYEPFEVKTQVVAGTNYRFKCHANLPGSDRSHWDATVDIFKPLDGKPHLLGITSL